jgi:hypothetical protein
MVRQSMIGASFPEKIVVVSGYVVVLVHYSLLFNLRGLGL